MIGSTNHEPPLYAFSSSLLTIPPSNTQTFPQHPADTLRLLGETSYHIHTKQVRECTYNIILRRVLALNITYYECVFVAFITHHAMRMGHIVICGLPRSTIFSKKKKVIEHKMCILIFYITLVRNISHTKKNERDTI